jgi:hypothetical protein
VPVRITRTKGFLKAYAKLTPDVQDRVDIALRQFVANPRHPGCTSKNTKPVAPCASIRAAGIAIRDLGNSHYELLDVDRHDRIDRRYSD